MIQQAIAQILTPIFELGFSESSYGFRPGRGAKDAVMKTKAYIEMGYKWVVDIDLMRYFDTVNHDKLMCLVAKKVADKRVHKFCRYADDGNIYVKSRRAGERVMTNVTVFLEEKLKLKVNPKKSAVDRPWSGRLA